MHLCFFSLQDTGWDAWYHLLNVSKYSHGDTGGGPSCSVVQLLQGVHLMLWVGHSLPHFLDRVDGVNEIHVVFVWLLEQPVW